MDEGHPPTAQYPGRLVLLRHGETTWSSTGQHTGRTDLPLTATGEAQAALAGVAIRRLLVPPAPELGRLSGPPGPDGGTARPTVITSPLIRAHRTAEIALGPGATIDADLVEWDYGGYDGLTSDEIDGRRAAAGLPDWSLFDDGVPAGDTPGESLADVTDRVTRTLGRVAPLLAEGDVVLVSHGHTIRVLAATFLGIDPRLTQRLRLDPARCVVLVGTMDGAALAAWNAG